MPAATPTQDTHAAKYAAEVAGGASADEDLVAVSDLLAALEEVVDGLCRHGQGDECHKCEIEPERCKAETAADGIRHVLVLVVNHQMHCSCSADRRSIGRWCCGIIIAVWTIPDSPRHKV